MTDGEWSKKLLGPFMSVATGVAALWNCQVSSSVAAAMVQIAHFWIVDSKRSSQFLEDEAPSTLGHSMFRGATR